MAASNAPKNDFAPPWLKIPSPDENTRPAGSKSSHVQDRSRQRRDENYFNRHNDSDLPRPLNRQNSLDVFDGSKHYSPSHNNKFRHHSMEDDFRYLGYGYGYPPYSVGYNDGYSMPFRSQPSLQHQEVKYSPSPSSRFGQVNGSYQPLNDYCDFFPSGEGFNSFGAGGHSSRRSRYARDGRGESKESRDSDRSSHEDEDKDWTFNEDFPSLNGTEDDGDVKTSKTTSSGGVWDNPPRSRSEDAGDVKNSKSGLYKVVPNKSITVRKNSRDGIRTNMSIRDASPLASVKPGSGREGQRQSPTQPMEILSTRLVRPKPVDKKSDFLKTLRTESDSESGLQNGVSNHHQGESNHELSKAEEEAEVVKNGVDDLSLDQDEDRLLNGDSKILSRSVEKEISFMRSLGWDETEETEEITEDEKREFKKLSDEWQRRRSGQNCLLSKSKSPQYFTSQATPQPAQDTNEILSSSDTDSDEDA